MSKDSDHEASKIPGERIYLDISSIKGTDEYTPTAKRHWRIMVDEATGLKFTRFFETKSGMVEPTLEQICKWSHNRIVTKYIRLDGAGENKKLQK